MQDLLKNVPVQQRHELASGEVEALIGSILETQRKLHDGKLKEELVDSLATHSFLAPYDGIKKVVTDSTGLLKKHSLVRFFEELPAFTFTKFGVKEEDFTISLWIVMKSEQYETMRHTFYRAQQVVNSENRDGGVKINLYIDTEDEQTLLPYGFNEVKLEPQLEENVNLESA